MTNPSKKRGFRSIRVQNIDFNWCFKGTIDVRVDAHKNNMMIIDFGWYDVWEFVNQKEKIPPDFEPKVVTPQFISDSIKYALKNGWNIELSYNKFKIRYKDKKYKVLD